MAKIIIFLVFKYCLGHVHLIKMILKFFVSLILAIKPVSFLSLIKNAANSSGLGVVYVCRSRGAGSTHVNVCSIHEVRSSVCRSKQ